MKIFSGSSNEPLAKEIAIKLQVDLGKIELSSFANGEIRIWVKEDVKNQDCIVVQSFSNPSDKMIIEFLLMADALVRSGARKIFAVIPWLAYSLQDKVFRSGEPIAAKVIADLVSKSGISRLFTVDLHNPSIVGFFDLPVMHYSANLLFARYIQNRITNNAVVVSPDFGGMKRSRILAKELNLEQININKERHKKTGELTVHGVSGEVKGKTCLVFDDLINTGRTVAATAKILKNKGAKEIFFFASHHLYLKEALPIFQKSPINKIVITNSIYSPQKESWKKLEIISLASLLAEGIKKWL